MKADPMKQRKITTMFQVAPSVQEQDLEQVRDMEDFGEDTNSDFVEIKPKAVVIKKRKRDPSPIQARNWKEALGPPPPATNIKVSVVIKYYGR